MNNSSFNKWNQKFNTATTPNNSVVFGCVPNGDIEEILFNPNSPWGEEGVTPSQFYFHEYGHILHNRMVVAHFGNWTVEEDFFGEKVVNKPLEEWFVELCFGCNRIGYKDQFKSWYHQYLVDHREWWAETYCILIHKKMGWTLRPSQEKFYALCIEPYISKCPVQDILIAAVKDTIASL
jgi:hypothetical protein